jgi:hypothetical protein
MILVPETIVSIAKDDTIGGGNNIVAGASVNILKVSGGSATIYSDAAGTTPITLPTVTDSNGELKFFIARGEYNYIIAGVAYRKDVLGAADASVQVETFADLATTPETTLGMVVYLKQHTSGGLGGGHFVGTSGTVTNDSGTVINNSVTSGRHWKRIGYDFISVEHFGALGYPVDDTAAIQAAIDAFPEGKKINLTLKKYKHTSTIYLKYQGIFLVGGGIFATDLIFINASGGTAIKADVSSTTINGSGFSGINFTCDASGTAPSITLDFSGFSYSTFDDFEINNTRVNGVCMKGYADLGTAPYYNSFTRFRLFGGDYSQTGILFTNGAWGGGSRGPNANMFSNIMRAAALARVIDLKEGQGNLFNNLSFESVGDHAIILNDIAAYVENGTATSGLNSSLTDSTKSWTAGSFVNYSVTITSGAGIGQTRKITTNTATVLFVSPSWGVKLDGTSTYAISRVGAFENRFNNLRQEGLDSLNPNFVTCMPGAIGNRIENFSVSSLGTGKTINDVSGHPSNSLSNGKLILITEVIENPGASANINIWPKNSVLGGLGVGEGYSVEWLQVKCPGIVSGTATVTLDVGGVTVGGGSPSLSCTLDSVLVNDAFVASTDKEVKSSLNYGLFLNLTTDASMNSSTDFAITVCIAVH